MSTLRASFLVAEHIAKAKQLFAVGEELILPAAKDICRELSGEAAVQTMACVPLSARTTTRQIDEIAEDIEAPWYAIQVDESTDVDNKATKLVLCDIFFMRM